jgi:hypothetical protein
MEKKYPFRYNVAEGIIEPFWDPSVSELNQWSIVENGAKGVKINQYWCYVPYEWNRTAEDGSGISITRKYENFYVEGYDRLILCAVVPENGFLCLKAKTEQGEKESRADGAGKQELELILEGAKTISQITITVGNTTGESATGWLNWLGVQNDELLEKQLELNRQFDERWEGYIKAEAYEPEFVPKYGLIATEEELVRMREKYEKHLAKGGTDVFYERIKPFLDKRPEDMIGNYMRLCDDIRFCRKRDENQFLAYEVGETLVQYALLRKDKQVLRLAARYAMSLMMTVHWLDGFIADYAPGIWEHSAFVPSAILSDLAYILDGAGELFTEKAKKMIMKQMMEKGLGKVNSVIWRYDSIFKCNQLAWYSYGRMSAYAVLSREFPRLLPYMEIAREDIIVSMSEALGKDGGADEGISYFLYQPGNSGGGLFWYARALGKSFRSCLPEILTKTERYIDALSSITEGRAFLPICDFSEPQDIRGLAVMAYLLPKSLWVNAYHEKIRQIGGFPYDFISLLLDEDIPKEDNQSETFVRLEESGYVSSVRRDGKNICKVFVLGNKAGAGHNHEDKGSFLVEFNGEDFLTDPGMLCYGDAMSRSLKMCDLHNMLLPEGLEENPHPLNPLPYSFSPKGEGDEKQLHLTMNLTDSYGQYFKFWERTLDSKTLYDLTITDRYSLKKGNGVAALFNTWQKVEVLDSKICILGKHGVCMMELPEEVEIEEKYYIIRNQKMTQLRIHQKGTENRLRIEMHFKNI